MAYDYSRRNQLAQERGYSGYSEQRRVTSRVNSDTNFRSEFGEGARKGDRDSDKAAKAFYAFNFGKDKGRAVGSNRYQWYVVITGQVSHEKWLEYLSR